ncbi:MAG: methylated-DNA--[protein]-cysteine S-methyltransferase [Deltaproteobacteria bacterium]|nr:methylated-DNA--[protein]-cysteine S-methyltransferase [Deltaproteobacteria bacterium]
MENLVTTSFASPIGSLRLIAGDAGILWLRLPRTNNKNSLLEARSWSEQHLPGSVLRQDPQAKFLCDAREELLASLHGERTRFSVALDLRCTPFQRSVYEILESIPYGSVLSYGQVAEKLGKPGASRAVGNACGANPLALFIPCHRVVASAGGLGGFGGGLALKRKLLALERKTLGAPARYLG